MFYKIGSTQGIPNNVGGLPEIAWIRWKPRMKSQSIVCVHSALRIAAITEPNRNNVGQVAHVSPTPWVTSQEADITRRAPEAACWLRLRRWSNNSANSHPSPGPFNCRVLRACLVPQCSYRLIDTAINDALRIVTGCLHPTPADNLKILAGIQPAELRRIGAILSLPRRVTGPGHLLHSALIRPSSADARRLKSRHPFAPAAQQLISSSDNNNIRAAHWADHRWNAEWADNPTHRQPPRSRNDPPKKSLGPA